MTIFHSVKYRTIYLLQVLGVTAAAGCMGLTSYLGNPMFDAIGSLVVGGLLGCVASFIIYTNVAALVGRSIPQESLDKINAELEADIMVRVRSIQASNESNQRCFRSGLSTTSRVSTWEIHWSGTKRSWILTGES